MTAATACFPPRICLARRSVHAGKIHLSPFESRIGICPGDMIEVFDTKIGKISMIAGRTTCISKPTGQPAAGEHRLFWRR
jgi:hypothetical protein